MSYDINRIVDILAFLAKNDQDLTKLRINKLLFLIDKLHLRKYGRLVLGDVHLKLPLGPVAQITNNIISDFIENEDSYSGGLKECFKVNRKRKYENIILMHDCNFESLSESEIETIKEVLAKYGKLPTSKLVDITHKDIAWVNTDNLQEIDYSLFLIDLPDEKRKIIEQLIELDKENDLVFSELTR